MKVFLSWSGDRSRMLASALRDWLGLVLHFVEPWTSQSDIDAGERWANKVAKELEASTFGIIAITRENVSSPWILFEAGALARSMEEGRVIPLLLDLDFKEVTGPLAQFQAKKVDKDGVREIVESINKFSGDKIPDGRLAQLFEMAWPQIEKDVLGIPKATQAAKHHRPQAEILEELVASVRGLDIRYREIWDEGPRTRFRRRFHPRMLDEIVLSVPPGDPTRILMIVSFLRDDFPWIYELGMELYRTAAMRNPTATQRARRQLLNALRATRHTSFFDKKIIRGDTLDVLHFASRILEEEVQELNLNLRSKNQPNKRLPRNPASSSEPTSILPSDHDDTGPNGGNA